MRALVIGASGHIGNAIVRALLDRNHQVTAAGRRKAPAPNLAGLPVSYVAGDAQEPGQFDKWINGHDLVVDAAAPYPVNAFAVAKGGEDPILEAERRTRWLLEAVSSHGAILAYVGSFVTLARPRTDWQRMRAGTMRAAHPYFEVKELIESQVLDAARHGLRAVIVDPTYCLGPWDLHERKLCTIPLVLCGEIPVSINQVLNVIDVRDVAAALLAAMESGRYGEPLLLSAHDIATHDLCRLICEIGGAPPPRFTVSAELAVGATYAVEMLLGLMGREPLLPSGGMMMASAFDYMPADGALPRLGITPRPLSETITDAIRWYREIGYC